MQNVLLVLLLLPGADRCLSVLVLLHGSNRVEGAVSQSDVCAARTAFKLNIVETLDFVALERVLPALPVALVRVCDG